MHNLNEYDKLKLLHTKLSQLSNYKKNNLIEFIDLDYYKIQGDFINKCVDRVINPQSKYTNKKIFVIFGGNQSGKTEAGSIICNTVFASGNRKICASTIDFPLSVAVQQRKIDQYLPRKHTKYGNYNEKNGFTNKVVLGNNGSLIRFKTYEQGRESFQGDEYDLIWLDEECPYDIYQECLLRTVKRNGVILFTFTSLMGYTKLVNSLWQSGKDDIESVVLDLLVNPYISQSAKNAVIANIDPDEIESRVHGKPHIKQGLIYKEFKNDLHLIERFDYKLKCKINPSRYKISEGIDPHIRTPHHWLRFMYDTHTDILYIVDELKAPIESMPIPNYAKLLITERKGLKEIEYCQIDTSSQAPIPSQKVHENDDQEDIYTLRSEFYKYGIETILVTKDNQVGISSVKQRLQVGFDMSPKLLIFKDLEGVKYEISRYSWDMHTSSKVSEKSELINSPHKKDDHYMDILKYECIKRKLDRDGLDNKRHYDNDQHNKYTGY